jgi:hypothetical protein
VVTGAVAEPAQLPVAGQTGLASRAGVAGQAELAGQPGVAGQAELAGQPGLTAADVMDYLPRRFTGWATRRSLAPNSATGISFVLALCAAAWFSGGTRPDSTKGALALGGGYLAAWAAQLLLWAAAGTAGPAAPADLAPADLAHAGLAHAGLAHAGLAHPGLAPSAAATADSGIADAQRLAALVGALSEYAVYAGLAVGARAARWSGVWELATAVIILTSVCQTVRACNEPVDDAGTCRQARTAGSWLAGNPARAARLVLIAVVATVWDARTALAALLFLGGAATAYAMRPHRPGAVAAAGEAGSAGGALPMRQRSPERIARCRDDGKMARLLGQLVRGNLPALPPALAGLAATVTLAVLGLRNLPGLLVLTPLVAMMLAAPGSAYPHAGRLDWLVPAMLQAGQFLYIAAVGFGCGVPAPLTFALCGLVALRYAALVDPALPGRGDRLELSGGLGWEGRMLVVGLGAMTGLPTLAYGALTAYLGVLVCSKIMTSCHLEGAGR